MALLGTDGGDGVSVLGLAGTDGVGGVSGVVAREASGAAAGPLLTAAATTHQAVIKSMP